MIFVFCFFAAVLVFLSYKSFRGGVDYLNFFRRELAKPASDFTPFVSVIAPCRGLDEELEKNLAALLRQNFPRYEVIFAVDAEDDAAVSIIKNLMSRQNVEAQRNFKENPAPRRLCATKLVVAGKADGESQKVHNLREAVRHAREESEVFAFVDSDARPGADWLRNLIAPLRDENAGAATSYRWFVPQKFGLASEMRAVWNASIASALGANTKSNFCWGGSMAMRRDAFEKLNVRERWRGTLSDDFTVTRVMNEAGLPIHFVPRALAASVENCTFRECLEFTTRQMKITRVYAPHLWKWSFAGAALFNLVWLWGALNLVFYPAKSAFLHGSRAASFGAAFVTSSFRPFKRLSITKIQRIKK
jgi:cellulose synthase/poly-beta-1,6-N-acetylglucosamine synthase-like glycosyltransferase